MENYKSNSYKSKEKDIDQLRKQRCEKVITGQVKVKKKNEMRKLIDIFFTEDFGTVKSYIFNDVLVPSIKKSLSEIVKGGIDILLYGETRRNKSNDSGVTRIAYNRYFDGQLSDSKVQRTEVKQTYQFDDITFDTRGDAEIVLERLQDVIDQYDVVRVADLYDLVGITSFNPQANAYGWENISEAKVVSTIDGYKIRMPKAMPVRHK